MPHTDMNVGYREPIDTSRLAAEHIERGGRVVLLRNLVRQAYKAAGNVGLTADECAQIVQHDKLSIRPRVSELLSDGYLKETTERRKNESGRSAAVFVVNVDVSA